MADSHKHIKKGSHYKILNELEKNMEDNYAASILNLSKGILVEINKEIKKENK